MDAAKSFELEREDNNTHDLSRSSVDEVDLVALSDGVGGQVGSTEKRETKKKVNEEGERLEGEQEASKSSPDGRDGDRRLSSVLFSDESDRRCEQGLVLVDEQDVPRSRIGRDGT